MKTIKLSPVLGFFFLLSACTQLEGCSNKPSPEGLKSQIEKKHKSDSNLQDKAKELSVKMTQAAFVNSPQGSIYAEKNLVLDPQKIAQQKALKELCLKQLSSLPGELNKEGLKAACSQVAQLGDCQSEKNLPIYHYDKISDDPRGKRILALSLIHGDEHPSGSVSRSWMARLSTLNPRNSWRVIPVANPDGLEASSRVNSNGVDINRNFPTINWDKEALSRWKKVKKSDPRRYPGASGASEAETRCLIEHFKDFQPDFIISIHTPLGVLDFDGPKMNFPQFSPLPWISLGHFPGSLGRYMWRDHKVPVMTIELKGTYGVDKLEKFDRLQDISGTVAIQAGKVLKTENQTNN